MKWVDLIYDNSEVLESSDGLLGVEVCPWIRRDKTTYSTILYRYENGDLVDFETKVGYETKEQAMKYAERRVKEYEQKADSR